MKGNIIGHFWVTDDVTRIQFSYTCTVESRKVEVLGTRDYQSIESSNYREVDIRIYNPPK